jgi:hypothetical protein
MPEQTFVYVKDPELAWVPATLDDQTADKANVTVFTYKDEQSIICDGGKTSNGKEKRTVKLKDYAHGVLPLQNVDGKGNLLQFSDMVQLPYLHEVSAI